MIQIAILGFGVVGSGTAEVLTANRKRIAAYCGDEINIKYILDLREFPNHPLGDRVVHDVKTILNDPEVALVAEMMGGAHPAYDFSKAALEAGKSVVTSNKEVVATFGAELLSIAKAHHASYLFEASVGGGIPIIRPMRTDLASNEFLSVSGILNGTTNYILTKMKNEGATFEGALKEAQQKGYAEANPAADVEGLDAARKIFILAALAFGKLLDPNRIPRKGITGITSDCTAAAAKLGGAVKLIGQTKKIGEKIFAAVSPCFVPDAVPLSHIDDVFNGIMVDTDMLGRALFYGAGAGKLPTASAVTSDIMEILSGKSGEKSLPTWIAADDADYADPADVVSRRVYIVSGCHNCAEKAKAALGTEECVFLDGGKFAVVSRPMSQKEADTALASTGLEAETVLPVLD